MKFTRILSYCGMMMIFLGGGSAVGQGLNVSFEKGYGQVEIGSRYVGAEFHHSRPVPSRVSFYYPVANSIDLSTDYWQRYRSMPIKLHVEYGGINDSIGYWSLPYEYTPNSATFRYQGPVYHLTAKYEFCDDLPVMVVTLVLQNVSGQVQEFAIHSDVTFVARTCHTYSFRPATETGISSDPGTIMARFPYLDTDSAIVFLTQAGELPLSFSFHPEDSTGEPGVALAYGKLLARNEQLEIVWLIGSVRAGEENRINEVFVPRWKEEVQKNRQRIENYALNQARLRVGDPVIEQTVHWSRAVMASNAHYLDGEILPMPCPAEYNFYFTHDALLTNLGAVHFDLERVKRDLLYLKSLTREDSILPHAYYWKDGQYVTEFCGTDNWNHFWFIILSNSYLKHSGDSATIRQLYPILMKSIRMVMTNKLDDDLMYATRPDWWDMGNLYGARTYVTVLMIRALRDFAALSRKLDIPVGTLGYIQLADRMRESLVSHLWDDKAGYLLNMLDSSRVDTHYYSGSLVAVMYGLLDPPRDRLLLKTAEKELLDPQLGIRNAMPPDFHTLQDLYHFQGMEMGEPFVYANGGIWPQGTIWYGLALLETGQVEKSLSTLKKYLTLEGVKNSPNGQPSFYEYRIANPNSSDYGKIDKPTFLWSGGLYLYYLYRLAGVRENPWHLWFSPQLPASFRNIEYDIAVMGGMSKVTVTGDGNYFKTISWDGVPVSSAVLTRPVQEIRMVRGIPESPYLAEADFHITGVSYQGKQKKLVIKGDGETGQKAMLKLVSPDKLKKVLLNDVPWAEDWEDGRNNSVFTYRLAGQLPGGPITIQLIFDK